MQTRRPRSSRASGGYFNSMPNASDPVAILLNEQARRRLRKALKGYSAPGWAPLGIDRGWWRAFARGKVEMVPISTWRTAAAWYPTIARLLGPPLP